MNTQVALIWNWYEVLEGAFVSLIFILIPVLTHAEMRHRKREREAERRHRELLQR